LDETIVTGLDQPNAMAFLPDGRLLITEQYTGKIRLIVNGHVAATDPAGQADSVSTDNNERGLQGIAVDPRWPSFPYVYVGYTHSGSRISLVRYTATGDLSNASGENLVLGSKRILIHNFPDNAGNHNGLGLRFATDGTLLMTIGDDTDGCAAQSTSQLKGKLLRLDVTRIPAGGGGPVPRGLLVPPSGNPFVGSDSTASLVYAYGLRNPWRFSVDAMNGTIMLGDVGEDTYEELDEVVAGGNYGWPFREGPMVRTFPGCSDPGLPYRAPVLSMDRNSGFTAVVSGPVYRPPTGSTSPYPSIYQGNYFFGDYYNSKLRRMVKSGSTWLLAAAIPGQPNSQDWATGMRFVSDFAIGKDGSIYWLKQFNDAGQARTGMVRRIRYTSTTDVPPIASLPMSLSAAPNPFADHVDLHWSMPSSGAVTLEIFDTTGRRVRRFLDEGSSGLFRWDATDEHGSPVGPGVYLSRLRTTEGSRTVRMLRMR
jgi:glucose/arabinose dehydrogenase